MLRMRAGIFVIGILRGLDDVLFELLVEQVQILLIAENALIKKPNG